MSSARWWLTPSWAKDIGQTYSMFNARNKDPAAMVGVGEVVQLSC